MREKLVISAFVSIVNCIYCIRMILEGRVKKIEVKGSGECILEDEEGVMMRPHEALVVQTFHHRFFEEADSVHEATKIDVSAVSALEERNWTRARLIYCFLQATSIFGNRNSADLDFFRRTSDEDLATVCEIADDDHDGSGKSCDQIATELGL